MKAMQPSSLPKATHHRYNWLPDFVYGGMDGAVTTFAVVAGVTGANLSVTIVLILGFANLFADGFSMAVGKYSSDRAEKQHVQRVRERVAHGIEHQPERKRRDIEKIMRDQGFKGKELERAVEVICKNHEVWMDTIVRNKYNLMDEQINPLKGAMATFLAFNLIGFIPLAAYVFDPLLKLEPLQTFWLTACSTLVALFVVGAVKAKVIHTKWVWAGFETLFIGGMAATIAYLVGYLLKNIG